MVLCNITYLVLGDKTDMVLGDETGMVLGDKTGLVLILSLLSVITMGFKFSTLTAPLVLWAKLHSILSHSYWNRHWDFLTYLVPIPF